MDARPLTVNRAVKVPVSRAPNMKLEVYDASGKLLGTMPTSKRCGLSRVTWSMRLPAPRVPPAASAAFGAPTRLDGSWRMCSGMPGRRGS